MQKAVGREGALRQIEGFENDTVVDAQKNAIIKKNADELVGDALEVGKEAAIQLAAGATVKVVGEAVEGIRAARAAEGLPAVGKAVNSNLPHAVERAVERGVFATEEEAASGLRELSSSITKSGDFPTGAIRDTAHVDRVLVPVGLSHPRLATMAWRSIRSGQMGQQSLRPF